MCLNSMRGKQDLKTKTKQRSRDRYLRRTYGITLKEYNTKLKAQNNSCALCGKHKSNFSKSLAQDHNHKTQVNRGIVCYYCNKFRIGRHDYLSAKALYEYMVKYEISIP